ncbi:MAG: DNA topoisomerase IB [Betaproteobacteria bacterium]
MEAGLLQSSDAKPGISRIRHGSGFQFRHANGQAVKAEAELARIRALAIPPAYEEVWICPQQRGHIQATARDARGRKQYIYHPAWRAARDEGKFSRMIDFGRALPRIRRQLYADVSLPGLCREKVLAAVCLLLDHTLVRVGNEEYAQTNKSFGLTTLRNRHVRVKKTEVSFEFQGKSAVQHSITVSDPTLAKIVRKCLDIPGQHLFQYIGEDGKAHRVDSDSVNQYLKAISRMDISAKDFRTWAASVAALARLKGVAFSSKSEATRNVTATIKEVAQQLRNTPAVCRKSYVHPAIVTAYHEGRLDAASESGRRRGLRADEARLLHFLQVDLKQRTRH